MLEQVAITASNHVAIKTPAAAVTFTPQAMWFM